MTRPSCRIALLALAMLVPGGAARGQSAALVDIRDLAPQEYRAQAFVLASPQTVRIEAVAAEPRNDRRYWDRWKHEGGDWEDDDRTTWPAAAWILDARSREVVWDVRAAETTRDPNGLRRFSGAVRLRAGTYLAHYGSFVATSTNITGNINVANLSTEIRAMRDRRDPRLRYSGPYVDDGSYRELQLAVRGEGRRATAREAEEARGASTGPQIAALRGDSESTTQRYGFALGRETEIAVAGMGELRRDGAWDYGWILNADTRRRVWTMDYANTEEAGGSRKNRLRRETLRLPAGHYVAYYVTDDSHDPSWWNAMPPFDPQQWGLTLRVADEAVRARVRPFVYEPVPQSQTIVSLIGVGDDELRTEGFTLRRPMEVRIYALGEGSNPDAEQMDDTAWIVDANTRRRVWTMRYDDTEHAGGADKNRLFEGTLRLEAGSYLVYYKTDGSHAFGDWNSAPPAESRYWGISIFPASGPLDRGALAPFERPRSNALAELVRMRDNVRARRTFELDREQSVRVYAIGEGSDGEMYDYGWIEDAATGRTVWEMTFRMTSEAGGARKNRLFDGTVRLPAGRYVLRWESDDSHAYGDWNDDPPDDPEGWGITVMPGRP